ncbi:MAG: M48 family metalloprotease [Chitinivibrionales bacterium]|nr:M48 family metalloprotease [Chitinivibrionales bacterium]
MAACMKLSGLISIIALLVSCSKVNEVATELLISDAQEVEMGRNFKEQIEADTENFPLYTSKAGYNVNLDRYIDSIGQCLVNSQNDRTDIEYHFTIIDMDTVINAFAVPGGFIYIYTGLILNARNEAEIAGVLAHELGHITKRHGARQMVKQAGIDFVLDLVAGEESSLRTALDIASGFMFLKYSRDNEYQADSCSVEYLTLAGYNPNGMKTFLEYLGSLNNYDWGVLTESISTHPSSDKRVDSVEVLIDTKPASVTSRAIPSKSYNP